MEARSAIDVADLTRASPSPHLLGDIKQAKRHE